MKAVSGALSAHLAGETQTLATLFTCTLTNGTVLGFTSHDEDISLDGINYESESGYDATEIVSSATLEIDNLDLRGILVGPSLTEAALRAGIWDFAKVVIDMVNWADLSQGRLNLRTGRLGEVTIDRGQYKAELRGIMQAYSTSICESTSSSCRASLGDLRCSLRVDIYTVTGSIDSVDAGGLILYDAARTEAATATGSGYFEHGIITFTSGLNDGLSMEIKANVPGQVTLGQPMPFAVAPGDTYSMQAGCDRLFATCRDRFANVVNFRGEPYLRGIDVMVQQGRRQ